MAIVELAHTRSGSGSTPLLLLHGITENRHSFDPLLPLLEPHADVVAVDLRGHGESPAAQPYDLVTLADDVAAVADRTWPRAAPLVVGHSLGGIVATVLRTRHPVAGVVNVDQVLDLSTMQDGVKSIESLLRDPDYATIVRGMFTGFHGALPPAEVERVEALRRIDQEVVLGVWSPLLDLDRAGLEAKVDEMTSAATDVGPYLAIHGSDVPPGYTDWLVERTGRNSSVEVWPDLGHYPHLVEPDRFVARVLEFAERRA